MATRAALMNTGLYNIDGPGTATSVSNISSYADKAAEPWMHIALHDLDITSGLFNEIALVLLPLGLKHPVDHNFIDIFIGIYFNY